MLTRSGDRCRVTNLSNDLWEAYVAPGWHHLPSALCTNSTNLKIASWENTLTFIKQSVLVLLLSKVARDPMSLNQNQCGRV